MTTIMEAQLEQRMEMFKRYLDVTKMDHKPYQYDGVKWCLHNELRADPLCNVRGGFIADEMGLGKTIMMIGLMYAHFKRHTLIVVPPILLEQWYHQIYKTTGHKALIYHGNAKRTITLPQLNAAYIVLTTYGTITLTKQQLADRQITALHKVGWDRVIFDEAHHLRNQKTSRHVGARLLPSKIRWLVSGTPIQNSKKDFYSLCNIIRIPPSFYTETNNLRLLAKTFILKRTKKQVGIHISQLHICNNIVEWTSNKEELLSQELHSALSFSHVQHDQTNQNTIVNAYQGKGSLAVLLRAKQSCVYPKLIAKHLNQLVQKQIIPDYNTYKDAFDHSSKLDAVVDSILMRKDNGCGKLIFCHYREEIDEIASRLHKGGMNNVATLDGRISHSKRFDILHNKKDAIILQIQTGCEGLNLQENYSEIYFVSPHWNPAIEDQAIARCHRIGQTKPVYVQRFEMRSFHSDEGDITTVNIDKYVNEMQNCKRVIVSQIIVE